MLDRRNFVVTVSAAALLSGCGGGIISPSQAPMQIYVLNPELSRVGGVPVSWQLAVARPHVSESMETDRIALQRGQTMDYYANAEWSDPTARLVQTLLVEAFETSGRISGVSEESAGVRADYLLETELRNFEAHYDTQDGPPNVVIDIMARLVTDKGDVVGTLDARHESKATQNNVASVVDAFSRATGEAVQQIAGWVLGLPAQAPAAGTH